VVNYENGPSTSIVVYLSQSALTQIHFIFVRKLMHSIALLFLFVLQNPFFSLVCTLFNSFFFLFTFIYRKVKK